MNYESLMVSNHFAAWAAKLAAIRHATKCVSTTLDKIFVVFFYVLTQLPFTASEMELDYYHQKVNIQFTEQVAERHKT